MIFCNVAEDDSPMPQEFDEEPPEDER
jgi:hypothetical protein